MSDILLAYTHVIGIILLFGGLLAEWLFFQPTLNTSLMQRLVWSDLCYGLGALLVLASGFARAGLSAKGVDFYLGNPLFHLKLAVFTVVGLLSIYPTREFIRWRRLLKRGESPVLDGARAARIAQILRWELAIGAFIPLLAVLMARGVGR